ncbi:exodeoxyribonuclease V subunit gamma [Labilibaculum antarcticum]|uniref:RecBCD enzyme subunit RecC n=1 Tax=Labilibaculum antarcticum TaxID=1717717 RepID=A0A1Y1CPL6_9BACT|nr:exodeoxyribonuclease V subunit gamma [Labilibaculum antarcticum]BAX82367.1 exodeoxyribonuclease V subunit gamma [Labilibaculum antarcticum]
MSIYIYTSNLLENLAKVFSKNNRANTQVFGSDVIITQTEGIGSWLAVTSSQTNGIFANHTFSNPTDFINQIFKLADLHFDFRYGQQNLRWMLFLLLGKKDFIVRFPLVANYFDGNEIKRFQLAAELADIFDQYMLFRTDYIEAWNKGEHPCFIDSELQEDFAKQEAWQSYLWQQVKANFSDLGADRVEMKNRLLEKLSDKTLQDKIKNAFSQISFFGLSVISNYHMDIYNAIAAFADLNFYVLNPSPNSDWNSRPLTNDLLDNELFDSYNGLGKTSYALLTQNNSDLIVWDDSHSEMPVPNSLLGKIQHDIYANELEKRNQIEEQDLRDESIQIASSYTPVRELEVLYNYLLRTFEKDPSLKASDVLVQISDLEKYAPYIKAVFDHAPVKIPYSISDKSYKGADSIVGVLDQILSLRQEDLSSEIVVQLLDSSFIRNKFDITDLEFIRNLVGEANIRTGVDGRREDDTRFISWRYGLQRMLLAYAIKGGEAVQSYDDVLHPLDSFEGNDAYEMLRFKAFVDVLIEAVEGREKNRTLSEWKNYVLNDVLDVLIEFDEDSNDEYKYIVDQLNAFDRSADFISDEISYDLFDQAFNIGLFSENRKGGFNRGRLSFCSMIPLRSIPFKVIATLGLDSDKLPRKSTCNGFDLMRFEKRIGDRDTTVNDRYLFLETILSARKNLYLSYIGNSVKNNTEQPASLLLDEFLDYLQAGNANAKDLLFTRHPMHSFSKIYYSSDKKYYSYLNNWDDLAKAAKIEKSEKEEKPDLTQIQMKDVIRFCKDPFKYYYNNVLRIYYNDEEILLPETELFALDMLQQYGRKMDLLKTLDQDMENYLIKGKRIGYLPLANMGEVSMIAVRNEIDVLRNQWQIACSGKEEQKLSLTVSWDDLPQIAAGELHAEIDQIYGDKHLFVNVSSEGSRDKYLVEAWIKHLVLMANSCNVDTVFMAKYLEKPVEFCRHLMSPELAKENLKELVVLFRLGHEKIIPFLPKQGFKFVKDENYDENKMLLDLKKEGIYDDYRPWTNVYISKEIELGMFGNLNAETPDKEALQNLSQNLFGRLVSDELF